MFEALLTRTRSALRIEEPWWLLPEQQFAWAALQRLKSSAETLDRAGQLTVLSGPSGTGKSLLVRQGLREAHRQRRKLAVGILNAEDWTAVSTQSLPSTVWEHWAETCSPFDILVCDDLDRAFPDATIGEHVARWLEHLLNQQVQVVITLSSPPGRCPTFPPRLLSRLHGGLLATIPVLSTSSHEQFLTAAAASRQLSLSDEVRSWLIANAGGTLRGLRTALDRLTAEVARPARLHDLAAVQRWVSTSTTPKLALDTIAHEVAEEFGVSLTDLRASSRQLACRLPRQCAMHLAHTVGGWSMTAIGTYFGHRTHTSVSYSCRKFQESMSATPTLRQQLQRLQAKLHAPNRDAG
jgi:chromosomal replication initiator protein